MLASNCRAAQLSEVAAMNACFLEIDGVNTRIDKVVAVYEVWTMGELPFPVISIKVVQTAGGHFQASPNVAVRSPTTDECEYTCGIGQCIQEALEDAIRHFWVEVKKASVHRELDEADFVRSDGIRR
jgi:hypothetical protein